ncbi:MAG: hypothetical protein ACREIF_11130 [Chthoniobacterales bacterium]
MRPCIMPDAISSFSRMTAIALAVSSWSVLHGGWRSNWLAS